MTESQYLAGKVRKISLPAYPNMPPQGAPVRKRLLLENGELAQIHDADQPVHYLAFIELRAGTLRGNHFHKRKEESIYMVAGEVLLILEDTESRERVTVPMQTGDLVQIPPGIAHTLQVIKAGQAIEFAGARFDPTDTHRYPLAAIA